MRVKNEHAYWAVSIVMMILVIAYLQGWFTQPVSPAELQMSPVEAKLVRGAIDIVRADVEEGKITDANMALAAFSAALPSSVRDKVLDAFGKPDIGFFRDALDILEGKLP